MGFVEIVENIPSEIGYPEKVRRTRGLAEALHFESLGFWLHLR